MERYTVALRADTWPSSTEVGGKAQGIRELVDRGFEVPEGFCVTAAAFHRAAARCQRRAESLAEFRSALTEVDLPERLIDELREHVERIGARRWAVRSSAAEEDAGDYSFAGQQRTELDVRDVSEIADAIRRIWADYFAVETILYRSRVRVDTVPGSMAVVVQEMIEADVAGVAFTRDPLEAESGLDGRGRGDEMLVTASAGDAREVVEGRSGHHYRIDRATGSVVEGNDEGLLDSETLRRLVDDLSAVERALGGALDIEWALGTPADPDRSEQSRIYLLQARPITGEIGEEQESVWTNANVGEALPGVATPFTWSIIANFSRKGFERAFGTLGLSVPEEYELVGSFRGRVYLNLTQFISVASGIPVLEPEVLFEMAGGGGVELVRDAARGGSAAEFLMRLPVTVPRILASQLSMPILAQLWSHYFSKRLDAFFEADRSGWTRGELAAELDRIDRLFDRNGLVMLTCSSNFLMSYVVMKKFLQWFGRGEARGRERQLFEALDVRSAEPVLDLLELTATARRNSEVAETIRESEPGVILERLQRRARRGDEGAREFVEAFRAFRDEHGHRAPREAELSTPRWREESRFVFEILRRYLEDTDIPPADEYRRRWRRQRREVDRIVDEGFDPGVRAIFRTILRWARGTARIREFMRSHVVESLDLYRAFARECGRRLADAGILRDVDDVFYLRYEEIRAWLDGGTHDERAVGTFRQRVLVREALVEQLRELPDPPNTFVLCDGEMVAEEAYRRRREGFAEEKPETRDVLEGLSGNRGRVTGRARVIRDPEEEGPVRSGEILVAPYTDVGWTPLFLTASAIVVGLGGPLSHACIVAREFGIPTVVNAQGAADVIETGDRITVDGDEGVVIVYDGGDDAGSDRSETSGRSGESPASATQTNED